jgi:hypothetical protein
VEGAETRCKDRAEYCDDFRLQIGQKFFATVAFRPHGGAM